MRNKNCEDILNTPIRASVVGNTDGLYINPCSNQTFIRPARCVNGREVNLKGVNGIAVYRDDSGKMTIFQAGGWTSRRGMFVDEYPIIK